MDFDLKLTSITIKNPSPPLALWSQGAQRMITPV